MTIKILRKNECVKYEMKTNVKGHISLLRIIKIISEIEIFIWNYLIKQTRVMLENVKNMIKRFNSSN